MIVELPVILTIAKQYNSNFSIAKLRQILGTDKNGTNLAGMIKGLDYLGFDSKAVKVEDKKIDNSVSFPIIAHIQTTNNFLHSLSLICLKITISYSYVTN